MKTLYINGEEHGQAEKIYVDATSIVGVNASGEAFAIRGVKFDNITYDIKDENGVSVEADIDVDEELADAINAATTLTQLKAALVGTGKLARVKGKMK